MNRLLHADPVRRDGVAVAGSIVVFGFALGQGTLALPLLAVAAGYDAAAVGLLASVSAVSHMALRMLLPRLLARFTDRAMMAVAALLLAASYATLLVSLSLAAFVLAQLLQGAARGWFWTSSQTHAARAPGGTVKGIAKVVVWSNLGTMAGPAVAGLLATFSLVVPLLVGVATSLAAAAATIPLLALPTYSRRHERVGGAVWRRPGVDLACWSTVSTGGWRALLNSYIPVLMDAVGHGPAIIGAVQAIADLAGTAAASLIARRPVTRTAAALRWSVLLTTGCLVIFPVIVESALLALLAIGLSGVAAGVQMTLAPALASDSVGPHEQGDAIALVGTFRAGALLVTPAAISGALGILALPAAIAAAAIASSVPAAALAVRRRHTAVPTRR